MKLFKNRFGRQPLWWHVLNVGRIILSIFFKRFRINKYPNKYEQYKGEVGPLHPKKYSSRDVRKWSTPVLALAFGFMVWGANKALNFTQYEYFTVENRTNTEVETSSNQNPEDESDKDKIVIQSLSIEQIENLANTIAGQNAIWPGYKGDPKDHRAVQRHFSIQFAKFINGGRINVQPWWDGRSVAFAYAVSADGTILFVGSVPGGSIDASEHPRVYQDINEGISGQVAVIPAQDEFGEDIIMLYRIKVKFSIG